MGVLDEAIREHLDLKRRQGADEAEIKSIEDEAFGSVGDVQLEATEVAAAGPEAGDQLDKVFEAARQAEEEAQQAEPPAAEAAAAPAPPQEEVKPGTPAEEPEARAEAPPEVEVEQETRIIEPADLPDEAAGDAGDALEMERQNLAGHPTENYDVDAAIAEEVELDQLSESRLSEELDRALDGPSAEGSPPEAAVVEESEVVEEVPAPEVSPEPEPGEPEVSEVEVEEVEVESEESEEPPIDDASTAEASGESDEAGSGFFDQENPLEGTPDFLEESPESESLWFEQKDPGDFDFGD